MINLISWQSWFRALPIVASSIQSKVSKTWLFAGNYETKKLLIVSTFKKDFNVVNKETESYDIWLVDQTILLVLRQLISTALALIVLFLTRRIIQF